MNHLENTLLIVTACLPALACVDEAQLEADGELSASYETPTLDDLAANTANMRELYRVDPGRASMAIDFQDERQYALVRDRLLAAGLNPLTAPAVFDDLEVQRSAGLRGERFRSGEVQECDMFIIAADGSGDDMLGTDTVSSCFNDAPEFSFIDSCLFDAETNEPIMCDVLESYGEVVDTLHSEALIQEGRAFYADGIAYSLKDGVGQISYFITHVYVEEDWTNNAFSVVHPVDLNDDGSIKVALERLNHGVDYDYYHSTSPTDAPCNGNDVCTRDDQPLFPSWNPDPNDTNYDDSRMYMPIETNEASPLIVRSTGSIAGAKAFLVLSGSGDGTPPGGICVADFTDSEGAFNEFGSLGSAKKIKIGPIALNMGEATWQGACADNRVSTQLHIQVDVALSPYSDRTLAYRWRSNDVIDSVEVAWGCLPEGSTILMADGGEAPIESIELGDVVVADADGSTLTVVDTTRGTESEPLVVVEDSLGHSLEMTGSHPVPLADGRVVEARSLVAGQVIETADGEAELVIVEREDFDGAVYNLVLGTAEELAEHDGPTTMIANGFVVGDSSMQDALMLAKDEQRRASTPEIPEGMRWQYLGSQIRNFTRSL